MYDVLKYAAIASIAFVLIYIVSKLFKSKAKESITNYNNEAEAEIVVKNKNIISGLKVSKEDFPLSYGSRGLAVKLLQKFMNVVYKEKLEPDGKFGKDTMDALKKHTGKDSISYNTFIQTVNFASKYADLSFIKEFLN